jgi:hypothetical protein
VSCGVTPEGRAEIPTMVTTRACRAPHHPISDVGLIGGATC